MTNHFICNHTYILTRINGVTLVIEPQSPDERGWGGFINVGFIWQWLKLCYNNNHVVIVKMLRRFITRSINLSFVYLIGAHQVRHPGVFRDVCWCACGTAWGWLCRAPVGLRELTSVCLVAFSFWSSFFFNSENLSSSLRPRLLVKWPHIACLFGSTTFWIGCNNPLVYFRLSVHGSVFFFFFWWDCPKCTSAL